MKSCCLFCPGIVNSVLSWPAWVPLSRLSFGAYMIHDFIIFNMWLNFRNRVSEGYFFMVRTIT